MSELQAAITKSMADLVIQKPLLQSILDFCVAFSPSLSQEEKDALYQKFLQNCIDILNSNEPEIIYGVGHSFFTSYLTFKTVFTEDTSEFKKLVLETDTYLNTNSFEKYKYFKMGWDFLKNVLHI